MKIFICDCGQHGVHMVVAADKENARRRLLTIPQNDGFTEVDLEGPFELIDGFWLITPGELAGETTHGVIP